MRTRASRQTHSHGHGGCGGCGSCGNNDCCGQCVNPFEPIVVFDSCDDICTDDTTDTSSDGPCLLWNIAAERWPIGSTGFLINAEINAAGALVPKENLNNSPVKKFCYRSNIKDLGQLSTGPININLDIVAASYRQYFRVGATQAQLLNAPFVFFTGQDVTARYVQTHLEVQT